MSKRFAKIRYLPVAVFVVFRSGRKGTKDVRRTPVGVVLARSATPQQASAIDPRLLCCDGNDSSRQGFSRIVRSLQISPMARTTLRIPLRLRLRAAAATNELDSFLPGRDFCQPYVHGCQAARAK
jgi:hypothetical protein